MPPPASSVVVPYLDRSVLLADVNDVLDEDGRPIGEIRASARVRRSVETAYVMCPYPGSRSQRPQLMNASALTAVTQHWPAVLGVLHAARLASIDPPNGPARLLDIARTTATVLALPAFLLHSRRLPSSSRHVPAFVAAAHKTAAGLFGLAKNCLLSRVAEGQPHGRVVESATSLHRYAEESGILRSRTGIEACAGPPHLMREVLELLVDGTCRTQPDPRPLRALIGDLAELVGYARSVIDLTLWTGVVGVWSRAALASLREHLDLNGYAAHQQRAFCDATIEGALRLPRDVQRAYARGAALLLRDPVHQRLCTALTAGSELDSSGALESYILAAEHDALCVFTDLRAQIQAVLGWPSSPAGRDRDVIARCFGLLPSAFMASRSRSDRDDRTDD